MARARENIRYCSVREIEWLEILINGAFDFYDEDSFKQAGKAIYEAPLNKEQYLYLLKYLHKDKEGSRIYSITEYPVYTALMQKALDIGINYTEHPVEFTRVPALPLDETYSRSDSFVIQVALYGGTVDKVTDVNLSVINCTREEFKKRFELLTGLKNEFLKPYHGISATVEGHLLPVLTNEVMSYLGVGVICNTNTKVDEIDPKVSEVITELTQVSEGRRVEYERFKRSEERDRLLETDRRFKGRVANYVERVDRRRMVSSHDQENSFPCCCRVL